MIDVRDRLTERMNRARLEVEVARSLRPLAVVAIGALLALGFWGYLFLNVGSSPLADTYELRFAVDDATGVAAGRHKVRIKGIEVGTITRSELVDGQAILTAEIEKQYGRIYRDARVELRPTTALQEMFLDVVDRGSAAVGIATAATPLPATQTAESVNVAEVLQVFEGRTRARMAALLEELGGGLEGRGHDLRDAFVKLVPFLEETGRLSAVLSERARITRRLVRNFTVLTGELRRRQSQVRRVATEGGRTLRTLGDGSADLEAMLTELPPTLAEIDASFASLRRMLPDVRTAAKRLRPVADRLPTALSALRSLSSDAEPAMRALRRPVARLLPLPRVIRPVASDLADAAVALDPQADAVDHVTAAVANCSVAIYGFFQFTASVTKYEDALGPYPRGDAVLGVGTAGTPARDPNVRPAPGCVPGLPKLGEP